MIQPSSSRSAASVTAGSVLPCSSWPRLPIGNGCQSIARPVRPAAARTTLTHSGTTSSPMSSPSSTPIFTPFLRQSPPARRGAVRGSASAPVRPLDRVGQRPELLEVLFLVADDPDLDHIDVVLHELDRHAFGAVAAALNRHHQIAILVFDRMQRL